MMIVCGPTRRPGFSITEPAPGGLIPLTNLLGIVGKLHAAILPDGKRIIKNTHGQSYAWNVLRSLGPSSEHHSGLKTELILAGGGQQWPLAPPRRHVLDSAGASALHDERICEVVHRWADMPGDEVKRVANCRSHRAFR